MNPCAQLISALRGKGVTLWCEGDKLRFRARRGVMTAADLDNLRAMKLELIAALQVVGGAASDTSMQTGRAPLTIQQRAVWAAIRDGSSSHLDPYVLRITGPLDVVALAQSFAEVVGRHDSLRVRILAPDSVPFQQFDDSSVFRLETSDFSGVSAEHCAELVRATVQRLANPGCDMAVGPLVQATLLRSAQREYVLVWALHHIVYDGFSLDLLYRELWTAYADFAASRPSTLAPSPMQYSEYARWQNTDEAAWPEECERYWRGHLRDAAAIGWPIDFGTLQMDGGDYGHVPLPLPGESIHVLRELAAIAGTTFAMMVLSIYVAVLAKWCKQQDFVVGVAVTGRDRPGFEQMVGYCGHVLLLRIRLTEHTTFMQLLRRTAAEFAAALTHQDFGRAAAENIKLQGHAVFQWMHWPVGEATVEAPSPVQAERLPIRPELEKPGPFAQYQIMPVFSEAGARFWGAIMCHPSLTAMMRAFGEDFAALAVRLGAAPHLAGDTVVRLTSREAA